MEVIMKKPILLVILDGIGFSKTGIGDAVTKANTPTRYVIKKLSQHQAKTIKNTT